MCVFLGNPVERSVHWDRQLSKSVPCHELRRVIPEHVTPTCPLCTDPQWIGTRRTEGYAPVLVRNDNKRQWEQAVAVLTCSGLNQLDAMDEPGQFRGRKFAVGKFQQGRSTPMKIEELEPVGPDEIPGGLPPTFSVRPVMLSVWCPDRVPTEPITIIEPIPFTKRKAAAAPAEREVLDVPPELLADLHARGMHQTAAKLAAKAGSTPPADSPPLTQTPPPRNGALNGHHPKPPESPPDDPGELRPTIPMTAAPKPKPQMVPDPEQALRVAEARRRKQAGIPPTADEAVEFGRVLDYVLPNRVAGKGGAL